MSESPLELLFVVLLFEDVDEVDGDRPLSGCVLSLSTCFDFGGVRVPFASSGVELPPTGSESEALELTQTSLVPLPYPRTRISWNDVDMRLRDPDGDSPTLLELELE